MKKKLYFCTLLWNNVTMFKRIYIIILSVCVQVSAFAATVVSINDASTWRNTELSQYRGQTIEFDVPFYVCNNYNNSSLTISPRRIFQPTNQALPLSPEYYALSTNNSYGSITLTGVSGYHRMGEMLYNLVVKVNSNTSVSLVSCDFVGNTRADMDKGFDRESVSLRGEPTLIVCAMNLEYYLVENLGTGYGADSKAEHEKQRAKVSKALAKVNADIYGFVEIEQGQSALAEIAADLTRNTGRRFTYINDGGSASGSYTKAGYVYCSDKVQPYGNMRHNNEGVTNRKKMQAFVEKSTGEKFIFSLNHFKAKSGRGSGDNADKGDGQGTFNGDRVREAKSVLSHYATDKVYFEDNDILIMGDLNAYAMEDPITILRDGGMIDLHRAFHADSSYSYVYRGYAGYLDHALCNNTLYPQVTGMVAYHINSDESDSYTYDKSNDQTMFRCSDHDPVIVGLRLDSTLVYEPDEEPEVNTDVHLKYINGQPHIYNAEGGVYRIYTLSGWEVRTTTIHSAEEIVGNLNQGLYIINIYGQGKCLQAKVVVY